MEYVVIDFETKSRCDLKRCGAWVYAEHPSTVPLCMGYSVLNGERALWKPGDPFPAAIAETLARGAYLVAHNLQFERAIWKRIMIPRFKWPEWPENNYDTMASCARRSIPLGLDEAGRVLRLNFQKDMDGSRVMKLVSIPNKKTGLFNEDPALLEQTYDYCMNDVDTEESLLNRLGLISRNERRVWALSEVINERGVAVDTHFVHACKAVVAKALPPFAAEFTKLTGIAKAGSQPKCLEWLRKQGVSLGNMQKETIEELLSDGFYKTRLFGTGFADDPVVEIELPEHVEHMLRIRKHLTSASIKKLDAMLNCTGSGGRARGLLQYHAATTGRYAGRLLQPQNFPRGTLELGKDDEGNAFTSWEVIVPLILAGDPSLIEFIGLEPVNAISSSLRHALIASPGKAFGAGDFSTIEARIVLALAGQEDKVALLRDGKDIYCDMAQAIYHRPINKKDNPVERQVGKNSVLGLGFQMGADKFRRRYAKKESMEFAQQVVDTYREDFAPLVPELWWGLGEAATRCVWDGTTQESHGIVFALEDEWLTMRLPSGRKIFYFGPQRETVPNWDHTGLRKAWSYEVKRYGQWRRDPAYGGLLTANAVQGTARDLLVDRMFAVEKEGLPIVLTVHDEILIESVNPDAKMLEQIMCERPAWAVELGIPVATECWVGERYRK